MRREALRVSREHGIGLVDGRLERRRHRDGGRMHCGAFNQCRCVRQPSWARAIVAGDPSSGTARRFKRDCHPEASPVLELASHGVGRASIDGAERRAAQPRGWRRIGLMDLELRQPCSALGKEESHGDAFWPRRWRRVEAAPDLCADGLRRFCHKGRIMGELLGRAERCQRLGWRRRADTDHHQDDEQERQMFCHAQLWVKTPDNVTPMAPDVRPWRPLGTPSGWIRTDQGGASISGWRLRTPIKMCI